MACRQVGVPRGPGALRLLGQHGQRRLEAMREVAGLGQRLPHPLVLVVEQRVEVVDERLHLAG